MSHQVESPSGSGNITSPKWNISWNPRSWFNSNSDSDLVNNFETDNFQNVTNNNKIEESKTTQECLNRCIKVCFDSYYQIALIKLSIISKEKINFTMTIRKIFHVYIFPRIFIVRKTS